MQPPRFHRYSGVAGDPRFSGLAKYLPTGLESNAVLLHSKELSKRLRAFYVQVAFVS